MMKFTTTIWSSYLTACAVAASIEATKASEAITPRNLASIERVLELKAAALKAAAVQSAKMPFQMG